jgi:hypothetical protein
VQHNSFFTFNKNLKLLSAFFVNAGFCLGSLPVLAGSVIYHGNFCTPLPADINKIARSPISGVLNTSTSTATVECPSPLPYTSTSGTRVNQVLVAVHDRHYSENVTCTLYGTYFEGSVVWQASASSSGSNGSVQNLTITPPQNQNAYGLNMECTIPSLYNGQASYVDAYMVTTP